LLAGRWKMEDGRWKIDRRDYTLKQQYNKYNVPIDVAVVVVVVVVVVIRLRFIVGSDVPMLLLTTLLSEE